MLDLVLQQIRDKAQEWNADVEKRRRITMIDPVADTRAHDAQELLELADSINENTQEVTTAQYAKLHQVSPPTVTAWIRTSKIRARVTGNGYVIRRDEKPPKHKQPARPRTMR